MAGVHQYPNPADHPDAQPFLRHLAESKGDPIARMEFADWLQEQGYDNAASGQRWAAKYNRKPAPQNMGPNYHGRTYPNGLMSGGWNPHGIFDPYGLMEGRHDFKSADPSSLPYKPFDDISGGEDSPPNVFQFRTEVDPATRQVKPIHPHELAYRHEKDLLANVHHLRWTADNEIDMEPDLKHQDDGPNGNT